MRLAKHLNYAIVEPSATVSLSQQAQGELFSGEAHQKPKLVDVRDGPNLVPRAVARDSDRHQHPSRASRRQLHLPNECEPAPALRTDEYHELQRERAAQTKQLVDEQAYGLEAAPDLQSREISPSPEARPPAARRDSHDRSEIFGAKDSRTSTIDLTIASHLPAAV